jgi:hypothetical protein
MTSRLHTLLDRVKTWPAARQAEAETLLEAIEAQGEPGLSLSDDQTAEVVRRLSEPAGVLLTPTEARARLASRRA